MVYGEGAVRRTEIVETITVSGNNHAEDIAEIESDIYDLDFDAPDYSQRHATLLSERARLRSLPTEPAQVIEHPTGRTVGDVWASLDDPQRGGTYSREHAGLLPIERHPAGPR